MEELKERIEKVLRGTGNSLLFDRVDKDQKILYMEPIDDFNECLDAAFEIIEKFPEYASVVFKFNGYRVVVTHQTTKKDVKRLFHNDGCDRLLSECDLDYIRANRSNFEKYSSLLTAAIWESPEGIAAGEKLDKVVAEVEAMIQKANEIETAMQPSKKEYEAYVAEIDKIKAMAESAKTAAKTEYDGTIYGFYEKAIEEKEQKEIKENGEVKKDLNHPIYTDFTSRERYYLARLSGESSFSEIRANPDGYSRVSPVLKNVFNSPEGIAAGEKLDKAIAEADAKLEPVSDIEKAMQPSKNEYEDYVSKIKQIKEEAKRIIEEAKREYERAVMKVFKSLIEREKDKILEEAQKSLKDSSKKTGDSSGLAGSSQGSQPGEE